MNPETIDYIEVEEINNPTDGDMNYHVVFNVFFKNAYAPGDWQPAEIAFPAIYEACWNCGGKGSHVNRAIDGNGITSSEWAELGPDFQEDYMSGVYDVPCDECKGRRVMPAYNEDMIQLRINEDPPLQQFYDEVNDYYRRQADYAAECAAERRAESMMMGDYY